MTSWLHCSKKMMPVAGREVAAMHTVTLPEAQARLPELLKEVLRGEEVIILQDSAPAAKLVPVERPGYGSLRGQIVMADDFDAPLDAFADYMP
jgi:prevent-host-death family protein